MSFEFFKLKQTAFIYSLELFSREVLFTQNSGSAFAQDGVTGTTFVLPMEATHLLLLLQYCLSPSSKIFEIPVFQNMGSSGIKGQ